MDALGLAFISENPRRPLGIGPAAGRADYAGHAVRSRMVAERTADRSDAEISLISTAQADIDAVVEEFRAYLGQQWEDGHYLRLD